MNINILDKSIFSRIAAGEVVDKPASVVKELVENSIDAGATNITIEVQEGGIKRIKVSDNGSGMSETNLSKAFLPHSTSKITTVSDLDKIGTLGFRGEALSSIASVAKIVAISKVKNCDFGTKIEINGGEVTSISQCGAADGTTIIVDEIFYCIPARAKFLKKPKQEESEITNIISRLILANPNVAFKYLADNKLIFLSQGNGLLNAIYAIYGKATVDNLIPITYDDSLFVINGFIGKPTFSKPNRTYQTLIINGRYVINNAVSTAVYKAFESYLMKGNFPFFVLNVNVPLERVDVNVHPNKLDVKFEDNNKIFGVVMRAVADALLNTAHIKCLDDAPKTGFTEIIAFSKPDNALTQKPFVSGSQMLAEVELEDNSAYDEKRKSLSYFLNQPELKLMQDFGMAESLISQATKVDNVINLGTKKIENINLFSNQAFKIVGTLFNTYIIVEQLEAVYFIDQHAAHERLLYDKFVSQLNKKDIAIQQLLVPYILDVNYQESQFIANNISQFTNAGFEIEHFGANSFKVSTVPVLFKDFSLNSFFSIVLNDLSNNVNINANDIIDDYIAKSACRAAIKANDIIDASEMQILLNELNKINQLLLCPHGRPVVVKFTKSDLEKWFKRIT